MLNSETPASTAHAGHHFVGDEKNSVSATNLGDTRGIAFWRHRSTERSADYRLKNKSGDGISEGPEERRIQFIGAVESALWKCFVAWAVVAETRSDVAPFGEQRLVRHAARHIAADGHGAQGAAVITLAAGYNAVARCLSFFKMKLAGECYCLVCVVLSGKFNGCFGGFGTAGGKVHATAMVKIGRRESQKATGKSCGGRRMKLGGMRQGQQRSLFGHRAADFFNAMTNGDDGGLASSIEKRAAIRGKDETTFPANGNGKRFVEVAREKGVIIRHGMPGE